MDITHFEHKVNHIDLIMRRNDVIKLRDILEKVIYFRLSPDSLGSFGFCIDDKENLDKDKNRDTFEKERDPESKQAYQNYKDILKR